MESPIGCYQIIMFRAIAQYQFMQNAVWSCLMVSIVCAFIGVMTVERKMVMLSGGIAHTSYGGVGLGYLCGFEPLLGAMGFSVLAALAIGFVKHRSREKSDVIIAMFWSFGMGLGILFTSMMKGYPPEMTSYLFGNILAVSHSDILMMVVLTCIVVLSVVLFFDDWKTFLFDEEFAGIAGFRTGLMDYILLVLVALTCVVLIRAAGIILVIALLCVPSACSALLSRSLQGRIIISMCFGMVFCFLGLWISFAFNIPSGATIVIVAVACYCILWSLRFLHRRTAE